MRVAEAQGARWGGHVDINDSPFISCMESGNPQGVASCHYEYAAKGHFSVYCSRLISIYTYIDL